MHLIDVMATAVDLGHTSYPRDFRGNAIEPMQGVSLRPALLGNPLGRTEPLCWEHEGNKAVRDGKWKLVLRHRQPWQLFSKAKGGNCLCEALITNLNRKHRVMSPTSATK